MQEERLLTPQELAERTGLRISQIRSLMKSGRLEFVEISSRSKMLTMNAWERFQRGATKTACDDATNRKAV